MRSDTQLFSGHDVKKFVRWNSKTCQLHVNFTFSIKCWPCSFVLACKISFLCEEFLFQSHNISLIGFKKATQLTADEEKYFTHSTNTCTLDNKNKIYFILKRKSIVCNPQITRVQQGTTFSIVFYKNDVTDRPTSFFYREKLSALFVAVVD